MFASRFTSFQCDIFQISLYMKPIMTTVYPADDPSNVLLSFCKLEFILAIVILFCGTELLLQGLLPLNSYYSVISPRLWRKSLWMSLWKLLRMILRLNSRTYVKTCHSLLLHDICQALQSSCKVFLSLTTHVVVYATFSLYNWHCWHVCCVTPLFNCMIKTMSMYM